ncbi:MAG: hypothetical protein ACRDUX_26940, partial [Mycobacterium sp.]
MTINNIRRIAGYLTIPVVAAGILGGAALGVAGGAAAHSEAAQPTVAGALASVSEPTGTKASVSEPTGKKASVSEPTGKKA